MIETTKKFFMIAEASAPEFSNPNATCATKAAFAELRDKLHTSRHVIIPAVGPELPRRCGVSTYLRRYAITMWEAGYRVLLFDEEALRTNAYMMVGYYDLVVIDVRAQRFTLEQLRHSLTPILARCPKQVVVTEEALTCVMG